MTRYVRTPALAAVALIFSACATPPPLVIDQPIGPYNELARSSNVGTLLVYSDTESLNGDPEYLVHTNYTVLTSEGALVCKIDNHNSTVDIHPTPISLPAGRYKVIAKNLRYGDVSLVAVIQPGRETIIDLNEDVLPARTARAGNAEADDWVRLPSGQIIGSKAR